MADPAGTQGEQNSPGRGSVGAAFGSGGVAAGGSAGGSTGGAAGAGAVAAGRGEQEASLYLHPQTLARLKTFELRAKMIIEGVTSGQHRSPYQGFSVEFAQHRPYVAGDDVRHLDWKVYARSDKLHLKQYQQETNLDLITLVDASGSMDFGTRSFDDASGVGRTTSPDGRSYWSKFDHSTALAAALSYITLRQGDRAGLYVFADDIRAAVRRSSAQGTWRQIVGALSTQPVDRPTNLARAVDQVLAGVNNRCLIAIISDFFEDLDPIKAAIGRLRHRGHDVIAFQVVDRAEREFNLRDAAPFIGLEGEELLRLDPRAIRKAYQEAFEAHRSTLERTVLSLGFDYQLVDTHDWLGPPLAHFVAHRNAFIRRRSRS